MVTHGDELCLHALQAVYKNKSPKDVLRYAKGFKVFYYKNLKYVVISSTISKSDDQDLILYSGAKKLDFPKECKLALKIKTPVKKIVALSTTHLLPLLELGEHKSLVGFSNLKFINNELLQKRVLDKKIKEVGYPPKRELVLSLMPDLVMGYVTQSPKVEGITGLINLKIPVILNGDFLEKNPLARAEWIKFFALFYNKEKKAEKIFNKIETNYLNLKKMASKQTIRPKVLVGESKSGVWHAPNGSSDFVTIISDAGGSYIWKDVDSTTVLNFSLEEVLKINREIDFWFPQNYWNNKNELKLSDSRYKQFKPFINGTIYNNNLRKNSFGGIDYYETALMRPDLLIKDLIKILHPGLLPKHKLHWYQRLK